MIDEPTTRKNLVDKALREAGWSILRFVPDKQYDTCAVEEYETSNGPADYILFNNGQALAVVEAKKSSVDSQNVLSQARRYARGFQHGSLEFGEYHIPFIFSTNGKKFWFQDLRDTQSRSREVAGFYTAEGLNGLLAYNQRRAKEWLAVHPVDNPRLRPYQVEAIDATEQALQTGKRKMLLAMATGTGKTFVAVGLVHRLLKAGFAKRILFLVDRRALAAQAVSAFASFEVLPGLKFDKEYEVYSQPFRLEDLAEGSKYNPKEMPPRYLTNPSPDVTFVYVCTIQRMRIYLFGKEGMFQEFPGEPEDNDLDADKIPIPINAFDCIIADECHRGYTSTEEGKWRQVLEHFDALKIGLTATPALHTTAYFDEPVYRYDYERAVGKGVLVDYDAVSINSDITMKGLFLKPGEQVKVWDTASGTARFDNLEDERAFDTTELERKAAARDRNKKIIREFAKVARQQEQDLGHFPKTLVFAVNDMAGISHADEVVSLLRDEFSRGDEFVEKITGNPNVDRPLQRIREFRNRPQPSIAVTVDMLTTGVDIPKLENLVLMRPVKSRILFTQMLGRGTRKCEEINKDHFTVFDCFAGTLLEYFNKSTDFTVDPPAKPSRSIKEIVDSIYGNRDREYNTRVLVKRLQRMDKSISAEGRDQLSSLIPDGDIGGFAARLPEALKSDWGNTMKLLRDSSFQNLAEDYPKAPKEFVYSETAQDNASSEYLFRTTDGRTLKRLDYIAAFERFVKENPDKIQGLKILLSKPVDFHTEELTELRRTLATKPERYTEENLRKAYHEELADIISMVKHAANGEPILSAEDRVDRAMTKLRAGKKFTSEQEKWLELISEHLKKNIVIDAPDFLAIPFSRHGGWEKANMVFGGRLSQVLQTINVEMVS